MALYPTFWHTLADAYSLHIIHYTHETEAVWENPLTKTDVKLNKQRCIVTITEVFAEAFPLDKVAGLRNKKRLTFANFAKRRALL